MPFDPVFITTKTDHKPVEDRASTAEDEQTDHLHRRQTTLVQRHWDHLQRGICHWWEIKKAVSLLFFCTLCLLDKRHKYGWRVSAYLPPNKNEAKISHIRVLPFWAGGVIWSQTLRRSGQALKPWGQGPARKPIHLTVSKA